MNEVAIKTFSHAVVYDGVFYPAFTSIQVEEPVEKEKRVDQSKEEAPLKSPAKGRKKV